jgi:thiamine-phosphate pyrophosphorylase
MTFAIPRLYAIIDPAWTRGLSPLDAAGVLLQAGVRLIQYRDKHGSSRELFEISEPMAERVADAGGIFIVNDRADVARIVRAHGVHVGQDDLPVEWARRLVEGGRLPAGHAAIVGCSTHNLQQLQEAANTSADYIGYGPIFETQSKENPDPLVGLAGLKEARRATRRPLVAIGGITLETVAAVIEAGADAVAVVSDLLRGPDLAVRAREFLEVVDGCG